MPESIIIRPAREEDLPAMEWEGVYTKYRRLYRRAFIDAQQGIRIILVAVAGKQMIGQVFIQLNSSDWRYADGVERAYLYALRVRPGWQNKGIGTQLIREAENLLDARGFNTTVIAAAKDNLRAQQLYQRLGYRIFSEDPGIWYFTDDKGQEQRAEEPSWILEKKLPDHPLHHPSLKEAS